MSQTSLAQTRELSTFGDVLQMYTVYLRLPPQSVFLRTTRSGKLTRFVDVPTRTWNRQSARQRPTLADVLSCLSPSGSSRPLIACSTRHSADLVCPSWTANSRFSIATIGDWRRYRFARSAAVQSGFCRVVRRCHPYGVWQTGVTDLFAAGSPFGCEPVRSRCAISCISDSPLVRRFAASLAETLQESTMLRTMNVG